ncbi:unannotated protein [freshwater metagenome]|uniref:Unannotated protein n=1 Tax=freshwater metagenome TaxID=449393 RepID=A0A6J5YIN4_9ZZZZ
MVGQLAFPRVHLVRRTVAAKTQAVHSAALALIDSDGIDAVTMTEVAELAEVSRAWINTVFSSRSHLIAEVICTHTAASLSTAIDSLTDAIASAVGPAEAGELFERVASEMNQTIVIEQHWHYLEMVAWTFTESDAIEPVQWSLRRVHAALERCVFVADDRGWLRPGLGPVTVTMLLLAASVASRVEGIGADRSIERTPEGSLLRWAISAMFDVDVDVDAQVGAQRRGSHGFGSPFETRHDAVAQRILRSATSELESTGVDGFNLRTVSNDASVSWSAMYRRFPDRRALLEGAGQELLGRLQVTSVEQLRSSLAELRNEESGPAAEVDEEDPVALLAASITALSREQSQGFFIALAATRSTSAAQVLMEQQSERVRAHVDALRSAFGANPGAGVERLAGVCRIIAFAAALFDALPEVDIEPDVLIESYRSLIGRALIGE